MAPTLAVPSDGAPSPSEDAVSKGEAVEVSSKDASVSDIAIDEDLARPPTCSADDDNLQTDPKNCGRCGHDCLQGGTCQAGQCRPVVVAESATTQTIVGLDAKYVYLQQRFSETKTSDVFRVSKDAGTATPVVTGLANDELIGVAGDLLLWNENDPDGIHWRGGVCDVASCSDTIAHPFATDGRIVQFTTALARDVALYTNDAKAQAMTITWYAVNGGRVEKTMAFAQAVPASPSTVVWGFFASGSDVCWNYWPPDQGADLPVGLLYGKSMDSSTQRPSKLASELPFGMVIFNVSPYSVLLLDPAAFSVYRVPLPLGLGMKPPELLVTRHVKIAAIAEDSKGVYWFDVEGTLYHCSPEDCYNTLTVMATGQSLNSLRLYQDETALYWASASPYQIMRLAK